MKYYDIFTVSALFYITKIQTNTTSSQETSTSKKFMSLKITTNTHQSSSIFTTFFSQMSKI